MQEVKVPGLELAGAKRRMGSSRTTSRTRPLTTLRTPITNLHDFSSFGSNYERSDEDDDWTSTPGTAAKRTALSEEDDE
jgi:hypothetical protein